ncbi:MAG TPA: TIGR03067 domain-containing protein [Gemmataceae bacterium]|nr:TIGR03067 domain-containing protein [Gemmataceae bacterium]
MRYWIGSMTACLAVCFLVQARADQGKSDKELLQGSWEAVAVIVGGKDVGKEKKEKTLILVFKGDKLSTSENGKDFKDEAYKLDETKSPKQIDILTKGKAMPAIYELKDDTMRLGYGVSDMRPKDFSDAFVVITLKKKKS